MISKESQLKSAILKRIFFNISDDSEILRIITDKGMNICDLINYLENLKNEKYISYRMDFDTKDHSTKEVGYIISEMKWDQITILEKGIQVMEEIVTHNIYRQRLKEYSERIKVDRDYGNYVRISIETGEKTIGDILLDKKSLDTIKEYAWSINDNGLLITKNHYRFTDRRNRSINQIINEEELIKFNKGKRSKHVIYFKNGNRFDKRKENIEFIPWEEMKRVDRITGIYKISTSNNSTNSYEVRIHKNRKNIYLLKTTDYNEALYGAFLLRYIFFGSKHIKAFIDELNITDPTVNNLDNAVQKLKEDNIKELNKVLLDLDMSELFIQKIFKVIDKHKDLLA